MVFATLVIWTITQKDYYPIVTVDRVNCGLAVRFVISQFREFLGTSPNSMNFRITYLIKNQCG